MAEQDDPHAAAPRRRPDARQLARRAATIRRRAIRAARVASAARSRGRPLQRASGPGLRDQLRERAPQASPHRPAVTNTAASPQSSTQARDVAQDQRAAGERRLEDREAERLVARRRREDRSASAMSRRSAGRREQLEPTAARPRPRRRPARRRPPAPARAARPPPRPSARDVLGLVPEPAGREDDVARLPVRQRLAGRRPLWITAARRQRPQAAVEARRGTPRSAPPRQRPPSSPARTPCA